MFVHEPTLDLLDCHVALVLAIACIGAQWCLEHRNAQKLYRASMAIIAFEHSPHGWAVVERNDDSLNNAQPVKHEQHMSTAITLLGYAPWQATDVARDITFLSNVVTSSALAIAHLSHRESPTASSTWHEWARNETLLRMRYVAFILLQTLSIAFNVSPPLMSTTLSTLRLPCNSSRWTCTTSDAWHNAQETDLDAERSTYGVVMAELLSGSETTLMKHGTVASLTGYAMVHTLLQMIYIEREISSSFGQYSSVLQGGESYKSVSIIFHLNTHSVFYRFIVLVSFLLSPDIFSR